MDFFNVDKLGIGLELSGVYSLVSIENVMINIVLSASFPFSLQYQFSH